MVNYGRMKRCEVRDEVFHGPPNFVADVFASEDDEEFRRRRGRFALAGVHEYLVALNGEEVDLRWHRLEAGDYRLVEPDADGVYRSHALPDFWLPRAAVRDRDWWACLGCIERGVSRRANFA